MHRDWNQYRLGDLGRIVTGRTPPTSKPYYFGDKYPFITPSDMSGRKKADSTQRYLSDEGAELLQSKLIPIGSVAVSCIGWQMGKSTMTSQPSFTNQQLNTIIPNEKVDADFLYYALSTRRKELLSLGAATGVRTPILNKSAFSDLHLLLPPLPTQRKIAAILSAYDDLIENNTRRIALLEHTAQLLYREWFVHFRFPEHESVPLVDVSTHQLNANGDIGPKIVSIPDGWKLKRLGDIAKQVRRSVKPEKIDPKTPYIGLAHMPKKSIALSDWGIAEETQSTKLIFKQGEILFGKIRPYFHKVGVASVDGVCSTDAIVIIPKASEYYALTLACVSSEEFVEYSTLTSQGTKMPRANWKVLVEYPVLIPPQPILAQFNPIVDNIVAQIQNMIFRNKNLRQTRDLLLPRLISGQLGVSELEILTGEFVQ